jgi:Na+/H+ antiporter NhaD/arsenite permease-like protein
MDWRNIVPVLVRNALGKAAVKLKAEPFFIITLTVTVAVSFLSRPHASAISWNVIAILFSMMLVCSAFEECSLLTSLAEMMLGIFKTPKKLALAMVLVTGVLAMFITNDIALLTMVPLTLKMAKLTGKPPYMLVILETVSANIFSAVTPFGNPQNLFLYTYFNIPASEFFRIMLPFGLVGGALLIVAVLALSRGEAYSADKRKFIICNPKLLAGALFVFVVNILTVLRIVDYRISLAAAMIIFLFLAPRLLKKVDYILLLTFVLFFLFTDAVTSIPAIKSVFAVILSSKFSVLIASASLSQIISNVPAAVLLSGFTPYYRELLYGVSAGGLGTLIASLASLISYKLYIKEYPPGKYLKTFLIVNFVFLAVILAAMLLFIDML